MPAYFHRPSLLLAFAGFFFLFVLPSLARAEVLYTKEDRATVRVLAVKGVVKHQVQDPGEEKRKKLVTLAIAEGGHGSGVMLTYDGIIATAQHVIDDAEFVAVQLPDREQAVMAAVVYENRRHDVAFLKIPGKYEDFIPMPAAPRRLTVREEIFAIGYPFDATRKYPQSNAGVVAGELPSGELQLGISANPGNSGGPLLDPQGELLGLVIRSTNPSQGGQGIAVAVPTRIVKKYYERRVLGSARLERARSLESVLLASTGAAEVVARMASITTVGTAVEHIEGTDSTLRKALIDSKKSHGSSADFLALLSGHYWNEAIIRYTMDGRSYGNPRSSAQTLARQAVGLDPRVVQRSPFLYSVLGRTLPTKNADKSSHSAPRRIAGFRLGETLDQTRDACVIEDFKFDKTEHGHRCSDLPSDDKLTGPVDVRFCGTSLCRIDVIDRPSRALSKVWVNDFKKMYEVFKSRYGKHDKQSIVVPEVCHRNILSCLEKGTARLTYLWSWEGRTLSLSLGRLEGKPTMRVTLEETLARPGL